MHEILVIPGKGGSGPEHWQTRLEQTLPNTRRVEQEHWDSPDLQRWAANIDVAVRKATQPVLAIAHSFGCLATAYAVLHHQTPIKKIFFVAPADPSRFQLPIETLANRLHVSSELLASTNDPWLSLVRCQLLAAAWGSRIHVLGALGHINVASGHGHWPEIINWARTGSSLTPLKLRNREAIMPYRLMV